MRAPGPGATEPPRAATPRPGRTAPAGPGGAVRVSEGPRRGDRALPATRFSRSRVGLRARETPASRPVHALARPVGHLPRELPDSARSPPSQSRGTRGVVGRPISVRCPPPGARVAVANEGSSSTASQASTRQALATAPQSRKAERARSGPARVQHVCDSMDVTMTTPIRHKASGGRVFRPVRPWSLRCAFECISTTRRWHVTNLCALI